MASTEVFLTKETELVPYQIDLVCPCGEVMEYEGTHHAGSSFSGKINYVYRCQKCNHESIVDKQYPSIVYKDKSQPELHVGLHAYLDNGFHRRNSNIVHFEHGKIPRQMKDLISTAVSKLEEEMYNLEWSPHNAPNESCRYDHVTLETPLGLASVQWKSWKRDPEYVLHLNEDVIGNPKDLDDGILQLMTYLKKIRDEINAFLK